MGQALLDYLLTEAINVGNFLEDGTIEIPVTATVRIVPTAAAVDRFGHTQICLSVLGHQVFCLEATMSSGPGSHP
jgi:hypothetical protein